MTSSERAKRFSFHLAVTSILFATTASAGAAVPCANPKSLHATYISVGEVDATVKSLSPIYTDDEPVCVTDAGEFNVGVFVVGRPKKVDASTATQDGTVRVTEGLQLDHVTAIVRILKGAGTFVTGGTLVDGQRIANDDPDLPVIGPGVRGKLIQGGEQRRVSKDDMVVVPAGVVHGFGSVEQPLTYMVVRIDPTKVLPLK